MSFLNSLYPSQNRSTAPNGTATEPERTVKPRFEVKETDEAYGLTVFLPGVAKDGLEITAEDNQLRIVGRRAWKQPEGWTPVYREAVNAPFSLVLEHEASFDAEKISAELRDGVLKATLPKPEALKPRKITVS
jgi:HSP20 family molecular chaperone IbpA